MTWKDTMGMVCSSPLSRHCKFLPTTWYPQNHFSSFSWPALFCFNWFPLFPMTLFACQEFLQRFIHFVFFSLYYWTSWKQALLYVAAVACLFHAYYIVVSFLMLRIPDKRISESTLCHQLQLLFQSVETMFKFFI